MGEAIAPLARKLGMPIALLRIEGGYGVQPRWSDVTRKGKMRAYVSRVIMPEEYAEMTNDELFEIIRDGLYVNEACVSGEFVHKKAAEYIERTIYTCPDCGLSHIESHGEIIECKKCGKKIKYLPTKELVGLDCNFPHRFVLDWYNAQSDYINSLDLSAYYDTPMYTDKTKISEVIPNEKKILIDENAEITLYGNRVEIHGKENIVASFDEASTITVLGKNKLNIYHGGKIYQLKGDKRFCALKYVHIFNRYLNLKKGDENDKFLGL